MEDILIISSSMDMDVGYRDHAAWGATGGWAEAEEKDADSGGQDRGENNFSQDVGMSSVWEKWFYGFKFNDKCIN